jgi:5-methylcytosine-specific restriction endonuclease McrA
MAAQNRIRVTLTSSRIKRGLLAIPRKLEHLFPRVAKEITVFFDDSMKPHQKPYTPYESTARECRIYSLRQWFRKHQASEGDRVEIVKEEAGYRLIFRSREEVRYQRELQTAKTEEQAEEALRRLARLAQQKQQRKRVRVAPRERYEGVPASLRTILKTVYKGRCQICGSTFLKRDGEPYFEVHHVDPEAGHHPQNLLVLCANCHAQMEHAEVAVKRDEGGWVVMVVINGKERAVRQALTPKRYQSLLTRLPFILLPLWLLNGSSTGRFIV